MVSGIVFAALALRVDTPASIPIQIVPLSQNPFDRKETILESSETEPYGLFLLNDFGVSDKAYEAVVKNPDSFRIVKMIRKEASGGITAWLPNGKPVVNDDTMVTPNLLQDLEQGDVAMVTESELATGTPESAKDKPNVYYGLAAAKKTKNVGVKGGLLSIQPIGKPTSKFANIKVNVRVIRYVGGFPSAVGTAKSIEDVNYKVVGPTPDAKDKLFHLEVSQDGLPMVGNFTLRPVINWDMVLKDMPNLKNRRNQVSAKAAKANGDDAEVPKYDIDVAANFDPKYWSEISVLRASNIPAYLGHIAMEPISK